MGVGGGVLSSVQPESTFAPRGEWRCRIEAERLIALVTSIRIHLRDGLETKRWFLNSQSDLDI